MKIAWSPLAITRLKEISEYIALDNLSATNKFIDDVFNKVDKLKSNVEIGHIVPELNIKNFREIIFGNYRTIYKYNQKVIFILTVRNFKQILPLSDINNNKKKQ